MTYKYTMSKMGTRDLADKIQYTGLDSGGTWRRRIQGRRGTGAVKTIPHASPRPPTTHGCHGYKSYNFQVRFRTKMSDSTNTPRGPSVGGH
jgi:hypothetical protein